ncbi:MAG: acetylornithine transaminase [Verrucomicrobiota bacterium]|nr:acetylornithine transaminase [Verrucomicrobiota bacterium]
MNTNRDTLSLYNENILGNYAWAPVSMVRGERSRIWDESGKCYLDFAGGIAVNALGHSHPHWVKRVQEQAATLVHCSNAFRHQNQGLLAEKLVQRAGPGKVLFCNSGTEANEALIKLARLHGQSLAGKEGVRYKIICAEKAFHGRTFGGMAATPQEKIQGGFRPMLDGFSFGKLNDLESFDALIDDQTCAIFVETIQGEGGVHAANAEFLHGLRMLCDKHDLLLILDEVQCGAGRTGRYYAFEHSGVRPDAIGMAKGIGGGFPMGAIWVADKFTGLFKPGSHGSTFAGSPLGCAAGLAVMEIIEQEDLLGQVTRQSGPWIEALKAVVARHPEHCTAVRGLGYMVALAMVHDPLPYITQLRDNGLLSMRAGDNAIRLLPALNATSEELAEAVAIIDRTLSTFTPPSAPAV